MADISWPPTSPRQALLTSPGGRRKYQEYQKRRENNPNSPLKHAKSTPDARSKARQLLLDENDGPEEAGADDDEETLQLKLQAIEARLRLKKLQKSKGNPGDHGLASPTRPSSSRSHDQAQPGLSFPVSPSGGGGGGKTETEEVQVPLSPARRPAAPAPEPASPSRFLLGIDKGLKGHDVSLKRPPSAKSGVSASADRAGYRTSRAGDPFFSKSQSQSFPGDEHDRGTTTMPIKSFSERMAESRSAEKSRRERAERLRTNRSSAFQFDKKEVEGFKTAAAEERADPRHQSSVPERNMESFSRDEVLRSYHMNSSAFRRRHTSPSRRQAGAQLHGRNHRSESGTTSSFGSEGGKTPDSTKFEGYSSLHLSNRILPHSFLSRTLEGKKVMRIPDLLRVVKGPEFELPPEIDGDYVVFGIVASKSAPRDIQQPKNRTTTTTDPFDDGRNNRDKYMAITLTDLNWTIDLFLFNTAFPRYYKLSEGVLIALLNPSIMPPPKHKLDTNRFNLVLSSSDDKVLEVGFARDIGYCKAVRKDGKTCQAWLDARKTEFCDFHVDLQVRRTQSNRMGVNAGTAMFGPGGRSGSRTGYFDDFNNKRKRSYAKPDPNAAPVPGHAARKPDRAKYDRETQSTYYVSPAPSAARLQQQYGGGYGGSGGGGGGSSFPRFQSGGQSTASLIDADDDNPFAATVSARGSESKEERTRRRLAAHQRERDITHKLVTSRATGVGAEYLRAGLGGSEGNSIANGNGASSSSSSTPRPTSPSRRQNQNQNQNQNPNHNPNPTPTPTPTNALGLPLPLFRNAANVRLSPMKRAHAHGGDRPGEAGKKTRFITANGIREAGRDSFGNVSVSRNGIRGATGGATGGGGGHDDDDDELDIV